MEPKFNQGVWLQSQAVNPVRTNNIEKTLQRSKVLRCKFHDLGALQVWSTSNPSCQCPAWDLPNSRLSDTTYWMNDLYKGDIGWWWLNASITHIVSSPFIKNFQETDCLNPEKLFPVVMGWGKVLFSRWSCSHPCPWWPTFNIYVECGHRATSPHSLSHCT